MTIGKRIQAVRKKRGLTQKELAAKLGLATGSIQQYELDKRQPRLEQLQNIANALEVPLSELTGEQTETIGSALLSLFRDSGYTFQEVVEKTGIDPQKLFAIASGEHVEITKEDQERLSVILPENCSNLREALVYGGRVDLGLLALDLKKEFKDQGITVNSAEKIVDFMIEKLKSLFRNKDESEYGKISWLLNDRGKEEAKKRARELTHLEEFTATNETTAEDKK